MTRRLIAESLGTCLLLYIIVGSGLAAETLGTDGAVQLFSHAISVGAGLAVLVALFQSVSGSHFNPSVTLAFWRMGDLTGSSALAYALAQVIGGSLGVIVAHMTFARSAVAISSTIRSGLGLVGSEAIGTFVLVMVILALVRTGRPTMVPAAVGAWVAAIVFATSSTGFANPAVTLARMLTDSYTGIAPGSLLGFLLAQLLAGLGAAAVAKFLYPEHRPQTAIT